jgi:hypothetical protein
VRSISYTCRAFKETIATSLLYCVFSHSCSCLLACLTMGNCFSSKKKSLVLDEELPPPRPVRRRNASSLARSYTEECRIGNPFLWDGVDTTVCAGETPAADEEEAALSSARPSCLKRFPASPWHSGIAAPGGKRVRFKTRSSFHSSEWTDVRCDSDRSCS